MTPCIQLLLLLLQISSRIQTRQLQIPDRGDYGCSKFQFCPYIFEKNLRVFRRPHSQFLMEKFSTRKKIFQ